MSIMMCCEGKIIQRLSYEDTAKNSKNFETFFNQNIPKKSYIAIYMTHNIHIPALINSIKNCGHVFIPINKKEVKQEIEDLVKEASIQYLVSLDDNNESFENFYLLNKLVLGCEEIFLWKNEIERKPCPIDDSLLCILSTSGTTGKRKLIKIESYCIKKNVNNLSKIFNLNEDDVIFYGTPLTFDPSLVELFLAFETKATLLIVPDEVKLNSDSLFQTLFYKTKEYKNITFLQSVPSLFTRWTQKQIQYIMMKSQLRILVLGGEPFPSKILNYERSLKIFNIYGITEVSCWATIYEIQDDNEVFIGKPLEETFLKICDEEKEVQDGIGELLIGSKTRHCYINDEIEKVDWRFTGDLVMKNCQGMKYIGRNDSRIKRLGHQIFLYKCEMKILNEMGLTSKYVWHAEDCKLLLFILIPSNDLGNRIKILDKLRVKLLHLLSKEEFPDFIDIIPIFPVTQNGKIDIETLIEIYKRNNEKKRKKQPSKMFLLTIAKYLGHSLKTISNLKNCTFENLGGNSILYILLTNELKDIWGYNLPSEFHSLLLSGSIETCMHFLDNSQNLENQKRNTSKVGNHEINMKRAKYPAGVKVVWKFNLFGCVDATPLIFKRDGRIYVGVGSFANYFVILDASTGETKFLEQFPDSIGSEAAISLCSNYLYFGCLDGKLYCINLKDYSVAWSYQTEKSIKCKPGFCLNDKAIVFGSYDKHIHCIKVENGDFLWKTLIQESIIAVPILHKERKEIILTTLSGSCISISEGTGGILWQIKLKYPIFSAPILLDNNLISCDVIGNVYFINIESGSIVSETKVDGEIYSSIKCARNHLIIASTKGIVSKCKLIDNNSNCDVVNSLDLGYSISSTPVTFETDKRVLVGVFTSKGDFYLLDFENMNILTHWRCPGEVYSSCIFSDSKLYMGCRDDNLYCLGLQNSEFED